MNVVVNGRERAVEESSTVSDVVALAGVNDGRGVAVAVNGEVVSRSEWSVRRLNDTDRVEILRAVGGG